MWPLEDFRRNDRGELGTRTATLHADGVAKLRRNWVYLNPGRFWTLKSHSGQ